MPTIFSFDEHVTVSALERAETILANPRTYRPHIRRAAMNDLYKCVERVTERSPLDAEIARLYMKLSRIYELEDDGKAVTAWDTALARYTRMCDYQERIQDVMRKDRES